jgi:hypothetical protein
MSSVLAPRATLLGMNPDEIDTLFAEIARYLALVDLLRHEGYEPRWRAEILRR